MLAITAWAAVNCEVYMIAVRWCFELQNDEALYLLCLCNFLNFNRVCKGVLRINWRVTKIKVSQGKLSIVLCVALHSIDVCFVLKLLHLYYYWFSIFLISNYLGASDYATTTMAMATKGHFRLYHFICHLRNEKGTRAEICPAIVSAIVIGRSAIGHFFPCPLASDSRRILFKSGELFPYTRKLSEPKMGTSNMNPG